MSATGRTEAEIIEIVESAFRPLVCAVERSHGDFGLHFHFRVLGPDGSVLVERPPRGTAMKDWYRFGLLQNNDTDLENFVKRTRGLVEERLEEFGFKLKLDPWRLPKAGGT